MTATSLRVSVVVPVRNGASTLAACLQSIRAQQEVILADVWVLDSQSTDSSVEIAKQFGAQVREILAGDFNHGLTRNLGVELATGDLVYFTVQDASIASSTMLRDMVQYFTDVDVQGVHGMQAIPHRPDTNPALWFKRFTTPTPQYKHFPAGDFQCLSPKEQLDWSSWDNVTAMYRRKALLQLPFRETNFSEDWLWARDALSQGMKLVYDPALLVWHYHHQSFGYILRSQYIANYYFALYFAQLPTFLSVHRKLAERSWSILRNAQLSAKARLYWIGHNVSSLAGHTFSVFIFRALYWLRGQAGIRLGYRWLCKSVPQGALKST